MSSTQAGIDLRKYPRVSDDCEVTYTLIEDEHEPVSRNTLAMNISGGGMCFTAREPLPIGEMIALRVNLALLADKVVALARVVWVEPNEAMGQYDIGVEFWWIGWNDSQAQGAMLDYVSKKLEKE